MWKDLYQVPVESLRVFGLRVCLAEKWTPTPTTAPNGGTGADSIGGLADELAASGEYRVRYLTRGLLSPVRRGIGARLAQVLTVNANPPTLIPFDADEDAARAAGASIADVAARVREHYEWVGLAADGYLASAGLTTLLDALAEVERDAPDLLIGWARAVDNGRHPFETAFSLRDDAARIAAAAAD